MSGWGGLWAGAYGVSRAACVAPRRLRRVCPTVYAPLPFQRPHLRPPLQMAQQLRGFRKLQVNTTTNRYCVHLSSYPPVPLVRPPSWLPADISWGWSRAHSSSRHFSSGSRAMAYICAMRTKTLRQIGYVHTALTDLDHAQSPELRSRTHPPALATRGVWLLGACEVCVTRGWGVTQRPRTQISQVPYVCLACGADKSLRHRDGGRDEWSHDLLPRPPLLHSPHDRSAIHLPPESHIPWPDYL